MELHTMVIGKMIYFMEKARMNGPMEINMKVNG